MRFFLQSSSNLRLGQLRLAGASNEFVKLNGAAAGSPGSLLAPAEDAGEPATFITSLRNRDAAALEPQRISREIIWPCQRLDGNAPGLADFGIISTVRRRFLLSPSDARAREPRSVASSACERPIYSIAKRRMSTGSAVRHAIMPAFVCRNQRRQHVEFIALGHLTLV